MIRDTPTVANTSRARGPEAVAHVLPPDQEWRSRLGH